MTSVKWKTNSLRMEIRTKKDRGSILCKKLIVRVQTARDLSHAAVSRVYQCWYVLNFSIHCHGAHLISGLSPDLLYETTPCLDILIQLILIKLTTFWRGALYRIENQFISMNYTIIHFLDAVFRYQLDLDKCHESVGREKTQRKNKYIQLFPVPLLSFSIFSLQN